VSTQDQVNEEQLVVFELDGELYGVDISRVQEIDRIQSITVVPQVSSFIVGIINLRGHITPVVDLRTRFGLPAAQDTALTRIVVVKADSQWVGLVVDAVSEVLRVPGSAVEPPSALVTDAETAFLRGIAKLDDRLILLLDLDRILDKDFQISGVALAAQPQ